MPLGRLFFVLVAGSLSAAPAYPQGVFQDCTAALGLRLGTDAARWADLDNDGWVDLCASGVAWMNHHGTHFTRLTDVGLVQAAAGLVTLTRARRACRLRLIKSFERSQCLRLSPVPLGGGRNVDRHGF